MDTVEAITRRKSIRAFKADPVPRKMLEEILELALRAPSWANTQPWEFAVVTGEQLDKIRKGFIEKAEQDPAPDVARPRSFPEPFGARRKNLSNTFEEIKGLKKEDRGRKGWWTLRGLNHFGAPAVIYVCTDRSFYYQAESTNVWPVFDCGMLAENIMLLAASRGLGTVPQAAAVTFPEVIRKVLGIPESKLILVAISIGYPDWDDPINRFVSEREPLPNLAKWYGFD